MTGLSTPQTIYGVHGFTFFTRATKLPIGILKVIGHVQANLTGSFNDLFGGASRFPYDSEPGLLKFDMKLQAKQFDSILFAQALGATTTANAGEASGNVGALSNQSGTSIMAATTGIASVAAHAGSEADIKDGLYVVKYVSATTVDVYCMSDVDFTKGTAANFVNDALKITAAPLTVTTSGAATLIPGFGIDLIGGSGTIAFTAGDTAYFYARKVNSGSDLITVGQSTQTFTEFGVIWTSQKKGNGDTFEVMVPRAKAIGLPLNFTEQAWAAADVNLTALYDSTENCIYKVRRIKA